MLGRWLWLVVPVAALVELFGHLLVSRRAPNLDEWQQLRAPVSALKRPEDTLLVAPRWAEPLARRALGDRLWPLRDLARASYEGAPRALVVSMLGETHPDVDHWPLLHEQDHGAFVLSLRENPGYRRRLFLVTDAVGAGKAVVFRRHRGTRYDCRWRQNAPPRTGGLHGHVAFPRERFVCGGSEVEFAGVTIIDDQEYRPRRCVWAHPPREGALWLEFHDVPLGSEIRGHAGLSYFLMRDGVGAPVVLEAFVDDAAVGTYEHRDEWGWAPFVFPTREHRGKRGRLAFKIHSTEFRDRHFCFSAATR